MTDDQAYERAASEWLESGSDRTPPWVVDAVLLAIRSTPQERDLRVPWRSNLMPAYMRLAAAAAIVAVLGVGALAYLNRGPDVGTVQPSQTPSTAPPSPSPAVLRNGPLTAGAYTTQTVFPVPIMVTVPDGWAALTATGRTVSILDTGEDGAAYLGFWIVDAAERDPCGLGGVGDTPVGPTVSDLAAALAGAPGFDATGPTAVSVDGIDGEYVELTGPLPGCSAPEVELWRTADGSCRCMEPIAERNRLWILDVDGNRLVIDAVDYAASDGGQGTTAADLEDLEGMIDSIRISR
jgi:hypothetical protein